MNEGDSSARSSIQHQGIFRPQWLACFDLAAAMNIVHEAQNNPGQENEWFWLNLERYNVYQPEALAYLQCLTDLGHLKYPGGIATLGFDELCPAGARILSCFRTGTIEFTRLSRLDYETAKELRWPSDEFPILDLKLDAPIAPEVARLLASELGQTGTPLYLSLPSLSPDVANAMRGQAHELDIRIRNPNVAPAALAELVFHRGYSLNITVPVEPDAKAIRALTTNPDKKVVIKRRSTTDGWYTVAVMGGWYAESAEQRGLK